ncbi:MAG: hypothetical protein R3F07_06505 [Opitutaceae bacterium]
MADEKKKPFFSRFKIAFVIIAIILIPLVMDQLELSREDVKIAGRVCAGIAGIFTLYGIFTKMLRLFSFVIFALIVLAVLVSEGIIQAPHLIP